MPRAFGSRRRQSLRDVFHAILDRAAEWPADAVLIAGDLFDQDRITRDTIAFLRDEFARVSPVPIFIAPGNHDPYTPDSPYANEAWPVNVFIFTQPEWTAHKLKQTRLTIHGFAFDGPDISQNPFGTLAIEDDGRIHVALGHGSEKSHQPPEKQSYAPFDAQEAAVPGLAYLALGHLHSVTPLKGDYATTIYYAGAPEGHGFNETGLRYYLEVEIEEQAESAPPRVRVTPVPSSKAIYTVHAIDCGVFSNTHQLVEAIRSHAQDNGRDQIARINLIGQCPAELHTEIAQIQETIADDFAFVDLIDETVPCEDFAELATENTSLGAFIQRVNDEINDAPDQRQRAMLQRARELGLQAYRGKDVPVQNAEADAL